VDCVDWHAGKGAIPQDAGAGTRVAGGVGSDLRCPSQPAEDRQEPRGHKWYATASSPRRHSGIGLQRSRGPVDQGALIQAVLAGLENPNSGGGQLKTRDIE
jgi:hypothetical protein